MNNFEGGPWKLRNGDIVNNLVRVGKNSTEITWNYFMSTDSSDKFWDSNGNCHFRNDTFYPEFDIVENMNNFKYIRSGVTD